MGRHNFLNLGNHPDCQLGDTTTFVKPRFAPYEYKNNSLWLVPCRRSRDHGTDPLLKFTAAPESVYIFTVAGHGATGQDWYQRS